MTTEQKIHCITIEVGFHTLKDKEVQVSRIGLKINGEYQEETLRDAFEAIIRHINSKNTLEEIQE